jgi:hypothetical protein
MLDGYLEAESGSKTPQVRRSVTIRIVEIVSFAKHIHVDPE